MRQEDASGAASDALYPHCPQIAEREDGDEQADRQANAFIAPGVIRVMAERIEKQDADDAEEGRKEEGGHTGRKPHQQASKPTEVTHWDAKEITTAKRTRPGCRDGFSLIECMLGHSL